MHIGFLFAATLASTGIAQVPGPGLTWIGNLGGSAGSSLPNCTNLPVTAVRGDRVTLRVAGDTMAFFVLGASGSSAPCTPIPGLGNGLLLAAPITPIAAGVLTQVSPCLSCPPGYQDIMLAVPLAVPIGTALVFQALSTGAGNASFTVAITATVG